MTDHIILVRHARPNINSEIPSSEWQLLPESHEACVALAERIRHLNPAVMVTSEEPKANRTGQVIAQTLGLSCHTAPDLHEHDRSNEIYEDNPAIFKAKVQRFFHHPEQLVYGTETAHAAYTRFSNAVQRVMTQYPNQTVAIATHGTVISLFVARHNPIDVVAFWQNLKMPDAVVLTRLDFKVVADQY